MRIFLSCLQSRTRHPIPEYRYWEAYFKRGIEEAGHGWVEADDVDWAEGLVYPTRADATSWRDRTWERVVRQVREARDRGGVDFFLGYLDPRMVEPDAIAAIRALGIPVVNFFCDNVREFVRVPDEFRSFDLNWVPELEAVRMYARDGVPHIHAAMATWIPPEQRTHGHDEEYGVSFIGSRDALRERLFADAIRLGLGVELRGAGWPQPSAAEVLVAAGGGESRARRRVRRVAANQIAFVQRFGVAGLGRKIAERFREPVPDDVFLPYVRPRPDHDEYVRITQRSRVTLGVNRYPSYRRPFGRPGTYSRGRDIEAPMMGACYLTEWTDELGSMYELGREIETYRTPDEMVGKVEALSRDPRRRREMRQRAQRRALADHSVPRTIARIAERLAISGR